MEQEQLMLTNVTEELVRGVVSFLLQGPEYQTFCRCQKCELDIIALTLNTLPSNYVTTSKGREDAFARLKTPEYIALVNKHIIHAIHVVAKNPNH